MPLTTRASTLSAGRWRRWQWLGLSRGDAFGSYVTSEQDLDGDGRSDVCVGTVVESGAPGEALVVSPARASAARPAQELRSR